MARDDAKSGSFATDALPLMDQVFTTALYLVRNRVDAEDLVQETYLRALRFWHRYTPGTNCKAWLLTILHNVFRNRYRERQRRQHTVEFDEAELDPSGPGGRSAVFSDPEHLVLSNLLDGEVEAALRELPPDFLEVIVLVDLQELTYEDAAAAVGCPVGTIRSRLSRGRRLLHGRLRDYARARGLVDG